MSEDIGDLEVWPTSDSTVVDASVDDVMDVISDFDSYPDWASAIRVAEVLSVGADGRPSRVSFSLAVGGIEDQYVLIYTWSADNRSVEWCLESSTLQRSQTGAYRLLPVSGGTQVDYRLEISMAIPVIGRLRSRAERRILADALSELKRRAESR